MIAETTCAVCGLSGTQARCCRAIGNNGQSIYAHDECAIAAFEFAARAPVVSDTLELIHLADELDQRLCNMRVAFQKDQK